MARIASLLLLTFSLGCAESSDAFHEALGQIRVDESPNLGMVGTIPTSYTVATGIKPRAALGAPAPEMRFRAPLFFESLTNGRICFMRNADPSDYMHQDADKDLHKLQKVAFRVQAFDTLRGIPPRTIMVEQAGVRIDDITSLGAHDEENTGRVHYDATKDQMTDKYNATSFIFVLCGPAPTIAPTTRYITISEDGGWQERRLYVFAVTDNHDQPPKLDL